jgi:hypothetical protein
LFNLSTGYGDALPDQPGHLAWLDVSLGARFGVDLIAIQRNLESTFAPPYKRDCVNIIAKLLDDLACQTDSARPVVSFLAIEDF